MTEEELEIEDVDDESYYLRELSKLEKKLAIATKALSDIEDGYSESTGAGQTARQALKEIEGVK